MQLSEDKTILLKVEDSDLTHGTFIVPEEVTTIGDTAFYGCSALTQITIPEGVTTIGDYSFHGCSALTQITIPKTVTKIGEYAFFGCSALTQITIPEEVTMIGGDAFKHCNNLHVIVVNTSHDAALERIKNLLPEEHRAKVIKKSHYDNVIKFQQTTYQSMPHDPRANTFIEFYVFYHAKIPLSIFALMSGFETSAHQDFQKKAGRLPLPTTDAAFQQYKHDFNDAFGLVPTEEPNQPQESSADVLESQLLCIVQLRKYVGFIHQQKEKKQEKHPAFFTDNKTLLLGINNQLDAVEKTLMFLKGGNESDIQFTPKEIAILEKDFIGKTLGEYAIILPRDSSQQLAP